jgi:hypothetical protein
MIQVMGALELFFDIVSRVPLELLVNLSVDIYQLSRRDMRRINVTAYNLLNSFWVDIWLYYASTFLLRYGHYLVDICGPDALQSYLLYKPRHPAEVKPIALIMAECCYVLRRSTARGRYLERFAVFCDRSSAGGGHPLVVASSTRSVSERQALLPPRLLFNRRGAVQHSEEVRPVQGGVLLL